MSSRYAQVFRYFRGDISNFADKFVMYTALFPIRILNNVILLPIGCGAQNLLDALRSWFAALRCRHLQESALQIFLIKRQEG